MGRPAYPTFRQIEELRRAAQLPDPETLTVHNGTLTVALPPQALAVIELR